MSRVHKTIVTPFPQIGRTEPGLVYFFGLDDHPDVVHSLALSSQPIVTGQLGESGGPGIFLLSEWAEQ